MRVDTCQIVFTGYLVELILFNSVPVDRWCVAYVGRGRIVTVADQERLRIHPLAVDLCPIPMEALASSRPMDTMAGNALGGASTPSVRKALSWSVPVDRVNMRIVDLSATRTRMLL